MATTVYLSSTYEDLKDYRRVVVELLRKAACDELRGGELSGET